ncbi:MAG: T9SS type A sorting domain-containing protein [Bacteroidota bacterium]
MKNNKQNSLAIKILIIVTMSLSFGKKMDAQMISTLVGNGTQTYDGDSIQATSTGLYGPTSIPVDLNGNSYIADPGTYRIRKVNNTSGLITTIAGNGTQGYNGDNILATSAFINTPMGICFNSNGDIYFADAGNNRIRKITVSTGIITTIAGTGVSGFNGDNILATSAEINSSWGLALDAAGNIYIGDIYNNRIRKVTVATGIITTIAGTGVSGFNGDNIQATSAKIGWSTGMAFDASGHIYFTDMTNNRIRKITISTGIITTIAGTGVGGYNGDNIPATSACVNYPVGLCLDNLGNIFFADMSNNRVRMITVSTGKITTIAGTGVAGYNGDSMLAPLAQLNLPYAVFIDHSGKIYIADYSNFRVRQITLPASLPIELVSFTATSAKNTVHLNWTTATETNNDFFTAERTQSNGIFTIAGTVKGAGNSNQEIKYGFDDKNPFLGQSYYRLKQTDHDGKFTYSEMIPVTIEHVGMHLAYPNPFAETINIVAKDVSYGIITDISGKVVKTFQDENAVSTCDLTRGMYFLVLYLKGGESSIRQKIIKG